MWQALLLIAATILIGGAQSPARDDPAAACAQGRTPAARAPEIRTFRSGTLSLKAQVYRPCGDGPFPVVIYAHGAEEDPTFLFDAVGPVLAARGVMVVGPHRRGAGLSADQGPELFATLESVGQRDGIDARARAAVAALEGPHLDDIRAAIVEARAIPGADSSRIYLIGNGFGGALAMLAAERGLGLRAVANFAGAAATWESHAPLRERLLRAASRATVPVYVAQAANDYSTQPTLRIGEALAAAGRPHRMRIWPAYGSTADHGHGFGIFAADQWAAEVLAFFDEADSQRPVTSATPRAAVPVAEAEAKQ